MTAKLLVVIVQAIFLIQAVVITTACYIVRQFPLLMICEIIRKRMKLHLFLFVVLLKNLFDYNNF